MKTSTLILGGAAGFAALWTAGWFVGKTVYVEPEADKIVEQLRSGDVFFSFDQRSVGGFPFGYDVDYQGVQLSDSSALWRWSAQSMSVSSGIANAGVVALRPADASKLTIEASALGGQSDGTPLVFDVLTEDMVVQMQTSGDGVETIVTATSAEAKQATGSALITGGRLSLTDFALSLSQSADQMNIAGTLSAGEVENAYTISQDGVSETKTTTSMTGLKTSFESDTANVSSFKDFILADGTGSVVFSIDGSTGTVSSTGGPSAVPVALELVSGATEISAKIGDGRAEYRAKTDNIRYASVENAGSALPVGAVQSDSMSAWMEMPLRKSIEPAPYTFGVVMENVALDDDGWKQIDPAGAIDHSPLTLRANMSGGVRVLTDLGGDTFGQSPVDVETIDITELSISGLGMSGNVTGALNVAGNAATPDGAISVSVSGAFALMDQLVAGGLVAQEQAELYRMIISAYAEPGDGPDDLKADITVVDGAVSINGQPLQ